MRDLLLRRIDDADRAADLCRYPDLRASLLNSATRGRLSTRMFSTFLKPSVVMKCAMFVVSDVVDEEFSVRAHAHPFGFDTPPDVGHDSPLEDVDDGDEVIVLVGDVERVPEVCKIGSSGSGPRRQIFHTNLLRLAS